MSQQFFIPCIFCGSKGASKEHVWPKWLQKILPNVETEHQQTLRNTEFLNGSTQQGYEFKVKQGFIGNRKSKNVCAKCNSEWMSQLQLLAKPLITQMILGDSVHLDAEKQTLIAKWVVMTSIMGEFINPSRRGIKATDHKSFFNTKLVPDGWSIFLGKYSGSYKSIWHRTLAFRLNYIEDSELSPESADCHSSTLIMGDLFILAVSVPVEHQYWINVADYSEKLEQIWPIKNDNIVHPIRSSIYSFEREDLSDAIKRLTAIFS